MFIKKLDLLNSNLFKITSFIILYLSLYLSLYLGEDSTGGAFYDYLNQKKIVDEFVKNFNYAFFNYDNLQYTTRHSPILISIISILSKANNTSYSYPSVSIFKKFIFEILFLIKNSDDFNT